MPKLAERLTDKLLARCTRIAGMASLFFKVGMTLKSYERRRYQRRA